MAKTWRLVYGGTEQAISADLATSIQESISEMVIEEPHDPTLIDVRGEDGERMILLLSTSIPILLVDARNDADYNVLDSIG